MEGMKGLQKLHVKMEESSKAIGHQCWPRLQRGATVQLMTPLQKETWLRWMQVSSKCTFRMKKEGHVDQDCSEDVKKVTAEGYKDQFPNSARGW